MPIKDIIKQRKFRIIRYITFFYYKNIVKTEILICKNILIYINFFTKARTHYNKNEYVKRKIKGYIYLRIIYVLSAYKKGD